MVHTFFPFHFMVLFVCLFSLFSHILHPDLSFPSLPSSQILHTTSPLPGLLLLSVQKSAGLPGYEPNMVLLKVNVNILLLVTSLDFLLPAG